MSGRRPEPTDNLLLIAATTVLILTAQRYRCAGPDSSGRAKRTLGPVIN
jgi:hypothetical protein